MYLDLKGVVLGEIGTIDNYTVPIPAKLKVRLGVYLDNLYCLRANKFSVKKLKSKVAYLIV